MGKGRSKRTVLVAYEDNRRAKAAERKLKHPGRDHDVVLQLAEGPRPRTDDEKRFPIRWRDTPSGNSFAHGESGDFAVTRSGDAWVLTQGKVNLGSFAVKDDAEHEGERVEHLERRNARMRRGAYEGVGEKTLETGAESPTREEWEVIVTNPPGAYRGRILNLVPPGDGFAAGDKIILQGFHDDEEARHVATGISHRYPGILVTYGPKKSVAAEGAKEAPCGCGKTETAIVEKTEVNVIAVGGAEESARERGITDVPAASICRPFTRIERDPARFEVCMARAKEIGGLKNATALYQLVAPEIVKKDSESFYVVAIDFNSNLRDFVELNIGQRHKVAVDIEDILAVVILSKCDGFAVLHCHPSGNAEPSDADKRLTKLIRSAAAVACPNIPLVDHLIVGSRQAYSFADRKLYKFK